MVITPRLPFDESGASVPVSVALFTPAFRLMPEQREEAEVRLGTVVCLCGQERTVLGMLFLGGDGRFSNMSGDPRFTSLSRSRDFIACPSCARIFHERSALLIGAGGRLPVVAQYAPSAAYFTARREYIASLQEEPFQIDGALRVWETSALLPTSAEDGAHPTAVAAVTDHAVEATLTRLPGEDDEGAEFALRLWSQTGPNPITVFVTMESVTSPRTLSVAGSLTEFASTPSGGGLGTLVHLLGEVDATLLCIDVSA